MLLAIIIGLTKLLLALRYHVLSSKLPPCTLNIISNFFTRTDLGLSLRVKGSLATTLLSSQSLNATSIRWIRKQAIR